MAKKKMSIHWEDDIPISYEVDGVQYRTLEEIPNEADRHKMEAMLEASENAEFDDAEFEKLSKETQQVNGMAADKIIVLAFTVVAALLLIIAGISTMTTLQKLAREESAPGVVVEVVRREYEDAETDNVSIYFHPVVEFKARDGKRYQVELSEGSSPASHEVGDEVTVLYEPENPNDVRIKSFGSTALMWILPGITGIVGAVFLGAVLVVQKYLFAPSET